MTLLALALSMPAAVAAECAAGDSAAGVLGLLDLDQTQTLTIGPDCNVWEALAIQKASDLTINCAEVGCELPPIAAYDSQLSVVGGKLPSTAVFTLRSPYDEVDAPELVPGEAGIYAERSFLRVEDVEAADLPASTAAVFAWDSEVTVIGGRYERLRGMGIVVLSRAVQIDVSVSGTHFEDIAEVGLRADSSLASERAGVGNFVVNGVTFADMETADGDIVAVVDAFSHVDTVHYRSYSKLSSPLEVTASKVTLTDPQFLQTHGGERSATAFILGADTVTVEGGKFQPREGSSYSFKVYESVSLDVEGGLWEPMNTVVMSAETVSVSGVRFRLPARTGDDATLLASAGSTLHFDANSVCAEGELSDDWGGLFWFDTVSATFNENVFQHIDLVGVPFVTAWLDSNLTLTDNSFVNVSAGTLVEGQVTGLDFRNNLLYETSPVFELDTMPSQLTTGFNLLYSTSTGHWPDWWPAANQVTGTPLLIDGYSPNCEEVIDGVEPPLGPAPADGSPVIDAGDPTLPNSADDTPSDIGAIDYNHPVGEPEDTGGLGDTGDSGDGSGGGNVDLPGEVQYGGGCAFGGWGLAAAPLLLFWRRRRPGAAMRG